MIDGRLPEDMLPEEIQEAEAKGLMVPKRQS